MKEMNPHSPTDAATERIDWSAWLAEYGSPLLLYARQQCRSEADGHRDPCDLRCAGYAASGTLACSVDAFACAVGLHWLLAFGRRVV
ncbi:MAG: hypothetical protein IIV41_08865, partial [Akkermansia sp.]|nr:hypothetical protein [Akkermansia sp.]